MRQREFRTICVVGTVALGLLFVLGKTGEGKSRRSHGTVSREYAEGRSLFEKIWEPGHSIASGGDGLGPLYNETSCVGCHHKGGVGGGGGNERNVLIFTAFAGPAPAATRGPSLFQGELEDMHPGFKTRKSIVIHKHSTSQGDEDRLQIIRQFCAVQTRDDMVAIGRSTRNTPALFGAGLIDRISDSVLLDAEKKTFERFPEIKGRVSLLRDGRIGRFGWKGQTATLQEFVLAACANELGLEVPGHHQPALAKAKDFKPETLKLDLEMEDCNLLTRFVASIPRPVVRPATEESILMRGRLAFEATGCATCHAPRLGSVDGLFSDLLLHDLGDRFRDFGSGYGGSFDRVVDRSRVKGQSKPSGEAGPTEWRTPPLWGVADSAPYLHDGRADTLDEAIRLHGGEAEETTKRYTKLASSDRQALLAFLHSLTAPVQPRRLADYAIKRTRGREK